MTYFSDAFVREIIVRLRTIGTHSVIWINLCRGKSLHIWKRDIFKSCIYTLCS